MIVFTFILICVSGVLVESKTKLGDVIPLCSLNDVNVNDCLKTSAQNILPILAKGIKGWNLMSIDPFFVPYFVIGQNDGPISLRWEHFNTTINGFGKVLVTGASVSKTRGVYSVVVNVTTGNFSMIGEFKAKGRMLLFPLKNEGHEEIHSGSSELKLKFEAKPEKKNKAEHLKIEKLTLGLGFSKDIKIYIKNYSKKPTPMDRILSKFLTDNSQELIKDMRSSFEPVYGALIQGYLQLFFNKIPLNELFKQ